MSAEELDSPISVNVDCKRESVKTCMYCNFDSNLLYTTVYTVIDY